MIGDSRLMISDHVNEPERVAGGDPRGNGLGLKIYVDDVDDVFRRAIDAGATETEPLRDHYFGERSGELTDPFGFTRRLAQFVEDVSRFRPWREGRLFTGENTRGKPHQLGLAAASVVPSSSLRLRPADAP